MSANRQTLRSCVETVCRLRGDADKVTLAAVDRILSAVPKGATPQQALDTVAAALQTELGDG